ncbi:MAG: hypothetical protein A3F72_20270 [Bacteroidetes bacterium RIFCSPLOWO2_12_FULL_35_15]|nr:MAG: hypothetical protein A3F72_20270 [Bacteroidetes bacterium RIFCSPLOWO2_12_FULL_35_15]
MRKILSIIIICCTSSSLFAQYFYNRSGSETKSFFINLGYGIGFSNWKSKLENTALYDQYGLAIKSGNLKFKTKTDLRCYDLNVLVPVADIMLGLGLNFEENTMDKIEILNPDPDAGLIIFDQKFRFDKIYALVEVPFSKELRSNFSLAAQGQFGYYGYSGVDRENFFGVEKMSNTYFAGIGVLASYKVIPHVFVCVHPLFEYKYFDNNSIEKASKISHNIFSFMAIGSVRIDVSER